MLLVKLFELGSAFVELDISVNEFRRVAILFKEVHVKLAGTVGILREIRWFQTNVFQVLSRDAKPTMARVCIECKHALIPSWQNCLTGNKKGKSKLSLAPALPTAQSRKRASGLYKLADAYRRERGFIMLRCFFDLSSLPTLALACPGLRWNYHPRIAMDAAACCSLG